jgi:two-component system response regulator HydG
MSRVLVVDDHLPSAEALADALTDEGYEGTPVPSARAALTAVVAKPPDVVVTDLRMEGMDGLALLREIRSLDPHLPVILLTAYATIEIAVEATKEGAFCFLTKPVKMAELDVQVRNAIMLRRLHAEVSRSAGRERDTLIGGSAALRQAVARADRAATSDATVLITGETGTGKELFAQRIHEHSARAKGPIVAINAGAIPETLIESELFGYVRGAFTGATADRPGVFENANGGTLFLDEVGELSTSAQIRLLRVLQEGVVRRVGDGRDRKVDVRIVAATHRALGVSPDFRRDLYFRLNVIPIELPPLRARGEDAVLLFAQALRAACARVGRPAPTVDAEVAQALLRYPWPGNVRELLNVAERVAVLSSSDRVTLGDLPIDAAGPRSAGELPAVPDGDFDLTAWMECVEERVLRRALDRAGGVKAQAAASLGLERNAFRYKLKKYGIPD